MYLGLIQLFIFWLLGESLSFVLDLTINGAVLGMLLFFAFLMIQKGTSENVFKAGDFLIKSLPFLLLPGCVAIFFLGDIMQGKWLKVILAVCLSSLFTIVFTLFVMQKAVNIKNKNARNTEISESTEKSTENKVNTETLQTTEILETDNLNKTNNSNKATSDDR